MSAAAEFAAEAWDADDAHAVAVLLAEQSHGSGGQGAFEIHDVSDDFDVAQDLLIHQPLHFRQFVLSHRGVVCEVEAQAARFDNAASLLDMRTKHLAKGGMQQVSGGVIPHGGAARGLIYHCNQLLADRDGSKNMNALHHERKESVCKRLPLLPRVRAFQHPAADRCRLPGRRTPHRTAS